MTFKKPNFQFSKEPTHSQSKVIPHHHDALHSTTITLPQGLDEIGIFFFRVGLQPLLELVEYNQHLQPECPVLAAMSPRYLSG